MEGPFFQDFFHQQAAAIRAFFTGRLLPDRKITIGIGVATEKDLSAMGFPLHDFTLAALRARDARADNNRTFGLAICVDAGQIFAIASVTDHHGPLADGTNFV